MALDFSMTPELKDYADTTIVPGVTVKDLTFVSAGALWSEGLIAPSAADTFAANSSVDLFSGAIGDIGSQAFTTNGLTRSQTNMLRGSGQMDANICFVGYAMSCFVAKRNLATLATTTTFSLLANPFLMQAVLDNFAIEHQQGEDRITVLGPLGLYPAASGAWAVAAQGLSAVSYTAVTSTASVGPLGVRAAGVNNHRPDGRILRRLPFPITFLPQIGTRLTVKNGGAFATGETTDADGIASSEFLSVKLTLHGYKFTGLVRG